VRFILNSEFLEDVFAMNDFFLGNEELGGNRPRTPLRPQQETTGLNRTVPYLVTEYGGHMYPTKSFDQEQRQAEHVLRHLQVLNAAYGDPTIAGCIGWCAFDYNTHKDFGSGDRICHHGVMDMFREPKLAAYAYASQCEPSEEVVLQPVTFWTRGDRNIGGVMPLMVLTNCDEVELSHSGETGKRIGPDRETFPHLPHAPVILDQRNFTSEELTLWGMPWPDATITGFINGKSVKSVTLSAAPVPTTLEVVADAPALAPHDSVRVMVRALDQTGHKLPYFFDPVAIEITGAGRLIGPSVVPLRAGSTGFWVRATGQGPIAISVSQARLGTTRMQLTAT
jgi:beta-galactosidase